MASLYVDHPVGHRRATSCSCSSSSPAHHKRSATDQWTSYRSQCAPLYVRRILYTVCCKVSYDLVYVHVATDYSFSVHASSPSNRRAVNFPAVFLSSGRIALFCSLPCLPGSATGCWLLLDLVTALHRSIKLLLRISTVTQPG